MASGGSRVLRAGNPAVLVLVIGGARDQLVTIADSIASPDYFLVVGEPNGIETMTRSLRLSLVIVLSDVSPSQTASIESHIVRAPGKHEPIVVTGIDARSLAGAIHAHLG